MTDGERLLDCPFCGAAAKFVRSEDEDGEFVAVVCTGCGCGSGKHYPLMDDAKKNSANEWNKRAAHATPPAGLAEAVAGYVDDYEFRGDVDYTPTDAERAMIEDAIHGFLTIIQEHGFVILPPAGSGEQERHHD